MGALVSHAAPKPVSRDQGIPPFLIFGVLHYDPLCKIELRAEFERMVRDGEAPSFLAIEADPELAAARWAARDKLVGILRDTAAGFARQAVPPPDPPDGLWEALGHTLGFEGDTHRGILPPDTRELWLDLGRPEGIASLPHEVRLRYLSVALMNPPSGVSLMEAVRIISDRLASTVPEAWEQEGAQLDSARDALWAAEVAAVFHEEPHARGVAVVGAVHALPAAMHPGSFRARLERRGILCEVRLLGAARVLAKEHQAHLRSEPGAGGASTDT